MGFNSPLPKSLRNECDKAAKILREFSIPDNKRGPDKLIPQSVLMSCQGIAIITVIKAGFLMSIRAGSGVVVARLSLSEWSAPSAIGLGGLGGGFEIGAEVTDFVIVLNTKKAVESFMKGGNVTLGGNLSVAAGPIGRNVEADVALRNASSFYTYSKTRGLFAGISLEGSCFVERKGANRKLYGGQVRARDLLLGQIPQPQEATNLYVALDEVVTGKAFAKRPSFAQGSHKAPAAGSTKRAALKGSDKNAGAEAKPTKRASTRGGSSKPDGMNSEDFVKRSVRAVPASFTADAAAIQKKYTNTGGMGAKAEPKSYLKPRVFAAEEEQVDEWDVAEDCCKALFDHTGEMDCDLSFKCGDIITIITRTKTANDWWEGRVAGQNKIGIFPANYVKVL